MATFNGARHITGNINIIQNGLCASQSCDNVFMRSHSQMHSHNTTSIHVPSADYSENVKKKKLNVTFLWCEGAGIIYCRGKSGQFYLKSTPCQNLPYYKGPL